MQAIQLIALSYLICGFLMLLCANLLRQCAGKPVSGHPRIGEPGVRARIQSRRVDPVRRPAAGRPDPRIRRF